MLAYETIVALLLNGAEQSNLAINDSFEHLDPHSMMRHFTIVLIPQKAQFDTSAPTAQLNFTWSVAQSALSVLGNDAICEMYHEPHEPCPHSVSGCAYESYLDINIVYDLPLSPGEQTDISSVPLVAKAIQDITRELTSDEEPLNVDVNIRFSTESQALVTKITAEQQWLVGDEIHDEQDLTEALTEICEEMAMILEVLYHLNADDDAQSSSSQRKDKKPVPPDRSERAHYLRPPTA